MHMVCTYDIVANSFIAVGAASAIISEYVYKARAKTFSQ